MKNRIYVDSEMLPSLRFPEHGGLVWIPGGTFYMGSDTHYAEEYPVHRVTVDGFWMDRCAVTNAQWSRFVAETGYVTVAERERDARQYGVAISEFTAPASMVFCKPKQRVDLRDCYNWWTFVAGADWRHPEGPSSSIKWRADHPVVHITYDDAEAYATWAGAELPTEAEWEFAARGGLDRAEFVWGNEFMPEGRHLANTWQGEFPWQNLKADGYEGTAPVGSFPPNGYGLYDMAGNVWEWTSDWFQEHSRKADRCCGHVNPAGARIQESCDPRLPLKIPRKAIKGGSFLCAPNQSRRYRPAARLPQSADTPTSDLGFRCIVRAGTNENLTQSLWEATREEPTSVYSGTDS
jgi:formylglycine-generating enzyme required for sulfatase activity